MRVIEALRYIHAEWVMFGDMDENDCRKVFTKPMKTKNIPWDRLRRMEWKWVSSINFSKKGRNTDNPLLRKATDI